MTTKNCIQNQTQFMGLTQTFFKTMFDSALKNGQGKIEIRTFPKNQKPEQHFCTAAAQAANISFNLCNRGIDVYFGVNPRVGDRGTKENVHYLTAFHAEIDYGSDGHKKKSEYATYDETLEAIKNFTLKPTIVIHSGGGFHCYWLLVDPVKKEDIGQNILEGINKSLSMQIGGDIGTHNIDRVLRVPRTYNFKLPINPREVTVIDIEGP